MDAYLRAGIAIFNEGYYHAAHDAWEEEWLALPEGDDRDFLQGLIQFTAAVFHTTNDNWDGAAGLAESAQTYLKGLGRTHHGVALGDVRDYLAALETEPRTTGESEPPLLSQGGEEIRLVDLEFEATVIAAEVLAEELGYDERVIEQATEYAWADLEEGNETSPFVTLVLDFVRDDAHRGIVAQRLGEHVDRREQRESDVEGLFEP